MWELRVRFITCSLTFAALLFLFYVKHWRRIAWNYVQKASQLIHIRTRRDTALEPIKTANCDQGLNRHEIAWKWWFARKFHLHVTLCIHQSVTWLQCAWSDHCRGKALIVSATVVIFLLLISSCLIVYIKVWRIYRFWVPLFVVEPCDVAWRGVAAGISSHFVGRRLAVEIAQ